MKLNRLSAALAVCLMFAAVAFSPPLAAAKSEAAKNEYVSMKKSGVAATPISAESATFNFNAGVITGDVRPPGVIADQHMIDRTVNYVVADETNCVHEAIAYAHNTRYVLEREPTSRWRLRSPQPGLKLNFSNTLAANDTDAAGQLDKSVNNGVPMRV